MVSMPSALVVMALVVLMTSCDTRSAAACAQMDVAACSLRAHCGLGAADQCEAERGIISFGCGVDPAGAAACVEAINDALDVPCTDLPTTLPCPAGLLEGTAGSSADAGMTGGNRDSVYRSCSSDADCGGLSCLVPANRSSGFCSSGCPSESASECASPSNGNNAVCQPLPGAGFVCTAACSSDDQCASTLACSDGTSCLPPS